MLFIVLFWGSMTSRSLKTTVQSIDNITATRMDGPLHLASPAVGFLSDGPSMAIHPPFIHPSIELSISPLWQVCMSGYHVMLWWTSLLTVNWTDRYSEKIWFVLFTGCWSTIIMGHNYSNIILTRMPLTVFVSVLIWSWTVYEIRRNILLWLSSLRSNKAVSHHREDPAISSYFNAEATKTSGV